MTVQVKQGSQHGLEVYFVLINGVLYRTHMSERAARTQAMQLINNAMHK